MDFVFKGSQFHIGMYVLFRIIIFSFRWGLVSRVFSTDKLLEEAVKTADVIAGKSKIAVHICKQATNAAYESALTEGLRTEKRLFHATFATK